MENLELNDRRWCDRVSVQGAAAVLHESYLGMVYELLDISMGGARLKGSRALPRTAFDLLLRVSGRTFECRARPVWDDRDSSESLGVVFESLDAGRWVDRTSEDEIRTLGVLQE